MLMGTVRLLAGVGETDITPPAGATLIGEVSARPATGIRTPLSIKALLLSDGETTLAIATLDLFGIERAAAERMQLALAQRLNVSPECVLLTCSHTRGGPAATAVVGGPDADYAFLATVETRLLAAFDQAHARLQPAALGIGHAVLPHLVYNHRLLTRNLKAISAWMGIPPNEVLLPEGPADPMFGVLVIRDERGFPLCLAWSMAADNRFATDDQVSGDLPAFVQQELDRRMERHTPVMYLPGCAGDASYSHSLETTVDHVASAIMAVQLETPCDPRIRLGAAAERVILPVRDYSEFWSSADIELKWPAAHAAFTQELAFLRNTGMQAVAATVSVLRMGGYALAALPGIPFTEFGLAVRQRSPFRATLVVGNSGGYLGPIPTRGAFANEGYETWVSRSAIVGPGAGEFLVAQAGRMLEGFGRRW